MDATADAPADGRAARAARTRTAIVDALLALLDEGDLQPTATRIAERAGISIRLIYHHFGDLEALYRAVAARQAERVVAMVHTIPTELALDERIDRFVDERTSILEWITPVRRASLLQEPFSAELTKTQRIFTKLAEERIAQVFAAELDELAADERATVLAALGAAGGWNFWDSLRSSGRSVPAARRAVDRTFRSLLGA
jgi:TetR/AcrR family transcriptional regulator, regulator of autoinduction and epiphytic fitness